MRIPESIENRMKSDVARALAIAAKVMAAGLFAIPASAADVRFPTGSRVGLAPPPGFSSSEAFRGFDDKTNNAAILILEMPQQAYAEVSKAMTTEGLKKQGVIDEKKEDITLKNGKAVFIVGRQQAGCDKLRKWILVAESPDLTAVVTALVPESAKKIYSDEAVRDALTSLDVRPSVPIAEQMSLLPFKLDDLANMRAFRVEPNTVFLTDGPKDSIDAVEQPLLVVSAAHGGPSENGQREMFARNLFAGVPGFKDVQVVSSDVIRFAGVQTYQLMAEGKDLKTGADVKLVQWLRFGNGAFVRFLGIASNDNWREAFPRFRAVRDSLTTP
jgi:hypothetical protein